MKYSRRLGNSREPSTALISWSMKNIQQTVFPDVTAWEIAKCYMGEALEATNPQVSPQAAKGALRKESPGSGG